MAGLVPFNRKHPTTLSSGFDDFYNMLDDFFADTWPFRRSLAGDTFKVDVREQEKEYVIDAELPGVSKDEINIALNDGRLEISVNKETEKEDKGDNYLHRERQYASMSRNIYLADADSNGITAKLKDGVLNIVVPKNEKPDNSVKIEIE